MNTTLARYSVLALFILIALGGGTLVGTSFTPGEWYAGLQKPWFNPPNWLFGPAWTLLYILIGIAGWRVFTAGNSKALGVWFLQMALNFLWSPIFFGLHQTGLGLVVLVSMLVSIFVFIGLTWRPDRLAALCFLPYACWVAFAGLLNASLWWLN